MAIAQKKKDKQVELPMYDMYYFLTQFKKHSYEINR